MADAADTVLEPDKSFFKAGRSIAAEDNAGLRELLKHCSAATCEAACQFRQTGNAACLPAIILGVLERHVEPDLRAKLKEADDDLRLIEDLGIDSLTLMEVVALVEDVFQVSISNEELCDLRTLGAVKQVIACKLCGLPLPRSTKLLPGDWTRGEGIW